jgi:Protein of unknown function (DUF3710)
MQLSTRYQNSQRVPGATLASDPQGESKVLDKLSPPDRSENGPFDVSEIGLLAPYLDFGSIRISPQQDVAIKADIEESTKRIVSISLETEGHRLQLQAFAASKMEGLWAQAMVAIEEGVRTQGGLADQIQGALGPELRVQTSVIENGLKLLRESRFVGVDGPKWFLRGVLTGPELYSEARYMSLIALFRAVAVSRGELPLPPGDLLPISLPTAND